MSESSQSPVSRPTGINHVRLTVSDIVRSRDFYVVLLGATPAYDFTDQAGDPDARADPARLFAGCAFAVGDQLLGLRPAAENGQHFDATWVGLDHVSLTVGSVAELRSAAVRLTDLGVEHGEVSELDDLGLAILSVQDPDDINLELAAPLE